MGRRVSRTNKIRVKKGEVAKIWLASTHITILISLQDKETCTDALELPYRHNIELMLEVPSSSMLYNKVMGEKRCFFTRHNKSTNAYQISRDSLAQCIIHSLLSLPLHPSHYHNLTHRKITTGQPSTVRVPRFEMFGHVRIPIQPNFPNLMVTGRFGRFVSLM